jgi:hypothetical protein
MAKKLLGIVFLVGGIVVAIFGYLYMDSPQYKMMSMLNSVTGSGSDPTGTVAIIIGGILSIIGGGLLVIGSAQKQQ